MRYLITGANSGIGFASAQALAKLPESELILVCRSKEKGEAAQKQLIEEAGHERIALYLADLSSLQSLHELGMQLRKDYDSLDVLLNNAGGYFSSRQETKEGFEMSFGLNHLNYFLLTHYLLDLLRKAKQGRIINVASEAHRMVRSIPWEDLQAERRYGALAAYGLSKLCNILFTRELAHQLEQEGSRITVNCLHPGVVATNIFSSNSNWFTRLMYRLGKVFMRRSDDGAQSSVYLASSEELARMSGEYIIDCKIRRASKLAENKEAAAKLWLESLRLTGIEVFGKIDESSSMA